MGFRTIVLITCVNDMITFTVCNMKYKVVEALILPNLFLIKYNAQSCLRYAGITDCGVLW